MKIKLTILLSFLFSLAMTSYAQTKFDRSNVSFKVKLIVQRLKMYDGVSGELVGRAPHKPKQFEIFEKLKENANENELYELTNHPNPKIRAYAFLGLIDINSTKTLNALLKNQYDTVIIVYHYGCTSKSRRLIGFMSMHIPDYAETNNITLTADQNAIVKREREIYFNRVPKWATDNKNSDD